MGLLFGGKYLIQQDRHRSGATATVLAHQAPASPQQDPTEVHAYSIPFLVGLQLGLSSNWLSINLSVASQPDALMITLHSHFLRSPSKKTSLSFYSLAFDYIYSPVSVFTDYSTAHAFTCNDTNLSQASADTVPA